MFDIGWSELLVIGIVALIVIGPKELPGALRTLGQWTAKIRRMASEFQGQFQEAMREAEFADLKKEMDEMTATAESYAHFDPLEDVRSEVESAVGELPALQPPTETPPSGAHGAEEPPQVAQKEPPATRGEPAAAAASEPAAPAAAPDAGRTPA